MHSIIDEVAKAESNAAAIRLKGTQEAKELLLQAEGDVAAMLDKEAQTGREQLQKAILEAEEEGKKRSDKMILELEQKNALNCTRAGEKLQDAVSYLLGRVVSSE